MPYQLAMARARLGRLWPHLFHSLGTVVFQLLGVHGVKGRVEALARVQGDGVLMPRTYHTQPTMGVLHNYYSEKTFIYK